MFETCWPLLCVAISRGWGSQILSLLEAVGLMLLSPFFNFQVALLQWPVFMYLWSFVRPYRRSELQFR